MLWERNLERASREIGLFLSPSNILTVFSSKYNKIARQCEKRNLKVNSDSWKTFIWVSFNSNNFTKVQKTSTLLKRGIPELQSQQRWITITLKDNFIKYISKRRTTKLQTQLFRRTTHTVEHPSDNKQRLLIWSTTLQTR